MYGRGLHASDDLRGPARREHARPQQHELGREPADRHRDPARPEDRALGRQQPRRAMSTSYDYLVAGVFLLATRTYPVGTAAAPGLQELDPDAQPLTTTTTSQAVTPIDARHTVYCYSGCLPKRLAGEADSRQQLALFERAFAEDNAMIEAQQRVIARTSRPRMLRIRADHALNRFRRLMEGLMAAEAGETAANPAPVALAAAGRCGRVTIEGRRPAGGARANRSPPDRPGRCAAPSLRRSPGRRSAATMAARRR
jgi:hypothetical protein